MSGPPELAAGKEHLSGQTVRCTPVELLRTWAALRCCSSSRIPAHWEPVPTRDSNSSNTTTTSNSSTSADSQSTRAIVRPDRTVPSESDGFHPRAPVRIAVVRLFPPYLARDRTGSVGCLRACLESRPHQTTFPISTAYCNPRATSTRLALLRRLDTARLHLGSSDSAFLPHTIADNTAPRRIRLPCSYIRLRSPPDQPSSSLLPFFCLTCVGLAGREASAPSYSHTRASTFFFFLPYSFPVVSASVAYDHYYDSLAVADCGSFGSSADACLPTFRPTLKLDARTAPPVLTSFSW